MQPARRSPLPRIGCIASAALLVGLAGYFVATADLIVVLAAASVSLVLLALLVIVGLYVLDNAG